MLHGSTSSIHRLENNDILWRMKRPGILTAAALTLAAASAAQTLPEAPGREMFEAVCSECHEPTKVIGQHKTKAEWQSKVTEMLQEDQDVTQQEREVIVNYLAASFPAKVNVNKATAKDLENVLDVSSTDAQAIVRYREQKGAFKSLDDLKKVAALDAAKVESWKDRVEF
jgi:competence ComEA-like helix-hairpin-helix protein